MNFDLPVTVCLCAISHFLLEDVQKNTNTANAFILFCSASSNPFEASKFRQQKISTCLVCLLLCWGWFLARFCVSICFVCVCVSIFLVRSFSVRSIICIKNKCSLQFIWHCRHQLGLFVVYVVIHSSPLVRIFCVVL